MARITLGPLISDISGKTAGSVFSRWHGRNYVRRLVIPANPQSVLQTAQRNAMARSVYLWRSLVTWAKTALDVVGTGYRMSGYNWFCGQNVVDEKTYDSGKLMGHNPDCPLIADLALAAGAAGEIDVTWTDQVHANAPLVSLFYRKVEVGSEENEFHHFAAGVSSGETATITALSTGELYRVAAVHHSAAGALAGESDSAEQAAG